MVRRSIVKRPRPGTKPGQRQALRALRGVRLMIAGGLIASAVAWSLAGRAVRAGEVPGLGVVTIALIAFPLSIGALYFPHRPLLVRRRLLRGALVGACLAAYLSLKPLTLLWVALTVAVTMGTWLLSKSRPWLRLGICSVPCAVGPVVSVVGPHHWPVMGLQILMLGTISFLQEQETTRDALDLYQSQGGRLEDLYATASPEDRRPFHGATLIIILLVLVIGAI